MPTPSDEEDHDRVRVTVKGATRAELRERAKIVAAEFFGVEPDSVTLNVRSFLATPNQTASNGEVVQWKMTTDVYYKEVTTPVGPPEVTGTVEVPRRRGNGRSAPVIPANHERDDVDEFDDDEIDDDADDE